MTQFTWESEAGAEAQAKQQPEAPVAEPESLAMSVDEFSALEDRILRAVNLVKRERQARAEANERAAVADAKLSEQKMLAEQLQNEVNALRVERDHVRQRVERLLAQLDTLEV